MCLHIIWLSIVKVPTKKGSWINIFFYSLHLEHFDKISLLIRVQSQDLQPFSTKLIMFVQVP